MHEHLESRGELGHVLVERPHAAPLGCLLRQAGAQRFGALGGRRLGERTREDLLQRRFDVVEFEQRGPRILPGEHWLLVAVRAHEQTRSLDVVGNAVRIAVQVHVEIVERVSSGVGQPIEELALWTVWLAAEDVVAAAAEDHCGIRIDGLDDAIHGFELEDVFVARCRPTGWRCSVRCRTASR